MDWSGVDSDWYCIRTPLPRTSVSKDSHCDTSPPPRFATRSCGFLIVDLGDLGLGSELTSILVLL
jgi:hypothetical protein